MPPETKDHHIFPERAMIARIYRVDQLEEMSPSRVSIEFDGIDQLTLEKIGSDQDFRELLEDRGNVSPFGLVRLDSTVEKFTEGAGIEPRVGSWFTILLSPRSEELNWSVEHAQLTTEGYTVNSRGFISRVEYHGDDDEPPLLPLSAEVRKARNTAQLAFNGGLFPQDAILPSVPKIRIHGCGTRPHEIVVRDVGQANFISVVDKNGDPLVHFDVGWPVSFNSHTAPAASTVVGLCAPIILSHWDWDHLHGYYVFPILQRYLWLTPVQQLGPGASRVAAQLHQNRQLYGLATGSVCFRWGKIAVCKGPAGNRNQTGLAMRVKLPHLNKVLLTGDADYGHAEAVLGSATYSSLVVTHHGANFGGSVPSPHGIAKAVVSYGNGNTYNHPSLNALAKHSGWAIEHTASYNGTPRGSRNIP